MTTIIIKMEDADAEILHQLIINAEEEGEFADEFDSMKDDIEEIIADSDGLSHLSDGEMIQTCETLAEVF